MRQNQRKYEEIAAGGFGFAITRRLYRLHCRLLSENRWHLSVTITRRLGNTHTLCKWGSACKRMRDDRARGPPPNTAARIKDERGNMILRRRGDDSRDTSADFF